MSTSKSVALIGGVAAMTVLAMVWCATAGSTLVWGTLGEWMGALGSIAAAMVAVGIAIRDGRQRESDRRDQQAAQARLVTVETQNTLLGAKVVITNHSQAPVFAVKVESIHTTPIPMRAELDGTRSWPRIDRDQAVVAEVSLWHQQRDALAQVSEIDLVSADISYVDAAGLRWRRWANTPPRRGGVVEEREPPPAIDEYKSR